MKKRRVTTRSCLRGAELELARAIGALAGKAIAQHERSANDKACQRNSNSKRALSHPPFAIRQNRKGRKID